MTDAISINHAFEASWPFSPSMTEPIAEAHELVERGVLCEPDFRDFAFGNAVRLHGGMNPEFFAGTIVEQAAGDLLAKGAA